MAETKITNIIEPSIFTAYTMERSVNLSAFFRSGISVVDPVIAGFLNGGGKTFNLPFWQEPSSNDEVPAEGSNQTINNITATDQVARRQMRVWAAGSNDMAAVVAGDDLMRGIANYVADRWAYFMQQNIMSCIRGVIADNVANDSSDMVNDDAIEDGDNAADTNKINSDDFIETVKLFGDKGTKLAAVAMHSTPYYRLSQSNLIDFRPDNVQNIGFGTYLGHTVIVDDQMYTVAGGTSGTKYWTVLFERGAFQYGETTQGYVPTETDRDPDKGGGIDELYTRRVFCYHPRGFEFLDGSVAAEFPTNAELALALNWNRVYNIDNVGFVVYITNG